MNTFIVAMQEKDLLYKIGITLIKGIGNITGKQLIAYCGGSEAVFKESKSSLEKIPNIGKKTIDTIIHQSVLRTAEKEINFLKKYSIQPLFYLDDAYPKNLTHCIDGPIMLYYKGNTNLNNRKTIAVVGSRKATTYGKDMCEQIINDLSLHDPIIISGLAYGIDVTSHKSALKNNLKTVGVLGHGLSMVYPAGNRRVAAEMCSQGGLISEFLSETKPSKENFPKRNRIIAGMADVTIVIESAEKGGSLITADIANGYNREVFAIPGRISDKSSMGCNMLINTNQAILMRSAKDLEQTMGWTPNKTEKALTYNTLAVELTKNQKHIIELLGDGAQSIDFICKHISSNHSEAASTLLNLEFSGQIKSLPGKMYQLN